MRSFRLVAVALMTLMLMSCKTTQKSTEQLTVKSNLSENETQHISTQENVTVDADEVVESVTVVTEWSVPDSTGKQYPTKTAVSNVKRRKKKQLNGVQMKTEECSRSVKKNKDEKKSKKEETVVKSAGYDLVGLCGVIAVVVIGLTVIIEMRRK